MKNYSRKGLILVLLFSLLSMLSFSAFAGSTDVMLQGFNWESHDCNWYNTMKDKASDISDLKIDMVWFPQPASSDGGMGYLIQKYYDLNSNIGTQEQLKQTIAAYHAKGIKAIADIVINHRNGVGSWAGFESPSWGPWAVCSDDEWGQGTGNSDSGEGYGAARDLDHSNLTVQNDIKAWLNWLKDPINAGFDGWRYDYTKGYWGGYNKMYNEASTPYFSVGEFWPDIRSGGYDDSYPNIQYHRQLLVDWVNAAGGTSTTFDFTTKWQLMLAVEKNEYWRLGGIPGLIGEKPANAVTFLDNHDTGSTQGHWPFPNGSTGVMIGYAYILTHPGVPCVFWDHLYDWGLHDAIKTLIKARKDSGITSTSSVSVQKSEATVYAAIMDGKLAMKIGSGSWTPGAGWNIVASGTDYAVWSKDGVIPPPPVVFDPVTVVAGNSITVTYNGTLKSSSAVSISWGYDGGSTSDVVMVKQADGSWTASITVPETATSKFDCSFKDSNSGIDNNDGANYHADVTSNSTVNVKVHYESAWGSTYMHFNNGVEWTTAPGVAMSSDGNNWFSKTVQRTGSSITFVFNDGAGSWDNNNEANYSSSLTELWVKGGAITSYDPSTNGNITPDGVSFDPISPVAGGQVTVTYNGSLKTAAAVTMHWGYDGWTGVVDTLMNKQADGSWAVTVTVPTAATTKFDAVFKDGNNNWDNNGGSDYSAVISTVTDTEPPVVAFILPGSNPDVSGTFSIEVEATDNVGVTKVEFFVNNVKIGEDSSFPYSFSVDSTLHANGSLPVKVKAYDAAGNSTEANHTFTVNNPVVDTIVPVVSFTLNQDVANLHDTVVATINATDNVAVAKVEIFVNGVSKGTDTSAPYSLTVDTTELANIGHTIKVVATDTSGNSAYSEVNVTVNNGGGIETKKVYYYSTVKAANTFIQYKQSTGSFSAFPGDVMATGTGGWKVWQKDLASGDFSVRFIFSGGRWDNNSGSDYLITADTVWIKDGVISYTDPNLVPDTTSPTASITSPANGGTVANTVTVAATASDNVAVTKVEILIDGVLKVADTTAPYSYSWDTTAVNNATHLISIKAYDAAGNSTVKQISVTVDNVVVVDNPPIVQTLSVPAGVVSGAIVVSATATDDKGITSVKFYVNGSLAGEDSSSPYSVNINTASYGNGTATIKAVAVDTISQIGEMSKTITIDNGTNPSNGTKPYSTNPTVGKSVPNGTVSIDGSAGEWTDDMLIAIDMANDDPRSLGNNWTMHETPWDTSHLWACWDDNNLYIAWQYVDVTDIIDPANAGSSAGTKVFQMNLIQFIVIDTKQNEGATLDMWGKNGGEPYWAGADKPEYQIYLASNFWQGFMSQAVDNVFVVDDADPTYYQKIMQNPAQGSTVGTPVGTTGIEVAYGNLFAGNNLWGVGDVDDALASPFDSSKLRDFKAEGHDGGRDTFYEMKIPLSTLGLTRASLEANGIGIMLGQGEKSCMDTLPNDPATSDTGGVSDSNSPLEWADNDTLTVPFARIGHLK